jgi:hypothetical protein
MAQEDRPPQPADLAGNATTIPCMGQVSSQNVKPIRGQNPMRMAVSAKSSKPKQGAGSSHAVDVS